MNPNHICLHCNTYLNDHLSVHELCSNAQDDAAQLTAQSATIEQLRERVRELEGALSRALMMLTRCDPASPIRE